MTDAAALVVRDLRDLIAALDRRIPQLERPSEAEIARSAKALRDMAVRHIRELTGGSRSAAHDVASEAR